MYKNNNVFDVCDFILFYETSQDRTVTNLRLQKLLYFIQAKFYKETNKSCFTERMEAWQFGPVVPVVYRKYRGYGHLRIPPSHFSHLSDAKNKLSGTYFIAEILDQMETFTTGELVDITHCQNPWNEAREGDGVISSKLMRESFGRGEMVEG